MDRGIKTGIMDGRRGDLARGVEEVELDAEIEVEFTSGW
jgi:hypothetical protein